MLQGGRAVSVLMFNDVETIEALTLQILGSGHAIRSGAERRRIFVFAAWFWKGYANRIICYTCKCLHTTCPLEVLVVGLQ